MAKKYPKSEAIHNAEMADMPAYVTWGDDVDSRQKALDSTSGSLEEFVGIQKTSAGSRRGLDYSNLDGNTSGRPGLTRSDYDYFRPDEAVPQKIKHILRRADDIYQKIGLVKNVIDLMGDFAAQGIRLVHTNKKIERFYRQWFKKIRGKDRSERFLNNLYKTGNIVINRQTAKINLNVTEKLYKSLGSPDLMVSKLDDEIKLEKREIPWRYTFLDPVLVDVSAGQLSSFVSDKRYELALPAHLRKIINSPKNNNEKEIVSKLPLQIIEAAKTRKPYPLDPDKTLVFHYKKDDWQTWAYPMIYAIMDDITVIEKLKLADMAALDGAISNIRIFKLGSLEHKISPTKAAASKLAQILGNNVGGGTMDLVWGPDIELLESNTNVHQFLGEGKYIPHLNAVYAGLGIPPTLTGTYGAAGTTNNFISLKTLTQRLQYGRDILVNFWEQEIILIQKSMGFKYPAKIEFDRMDLSNEEAEKALLIQLADRNLISDELIQSRFGMDPEMEKYRLVRESKDREKDRMVKKSGPWHDPQIENSLKKIALQSGTVAPSQVGLELEPKKPGEQTVLDIKEKISTQKSPTQLAKTPQSLPGQPQQGRPKNTQDTQKRKTKEFSPQTGAKLMLWLNEVENKINANINPLLLEFYNKKNIRSLSKTEYEELDLLKNKILFSLSPFTEISDNNIKDLLTQINQKNTKNLVMGYNIWLKKLIAELGKELTVEEQKQAKAAYYVHIYTSNEG